MSDLSSVETQAAVGILERADKTKRRGMLADVTIRLIKEKPMGLFGLIIVLILLLTGIFAQSLAPYGYNDAVLSARLQAPGPAHILGTDNLGRDLLSRIIFGARVSMIVGLAGATLSTVIGFLVGGISGFKGGKYDMTLQRVIDALQCFPSLIIFMTVMSVVGQGMVPLILVLGISSGVLGSRTIRSAVIGVKENVYVSAAQALGARTSTVIFKHILPNVVPVMIIQFTLGVGGMILMEATLSFLGLGVPPPNPTWGGMLSGAGRQYMFEAPWMVLWPGLALGASVYGINMLGDALRDLWDPRLRGGLGRYGQKVEKPKSARVLEGPQTASA